MAKNFGNLRIAHLSAYIHLDKAMQFLYNNPNKGNWRRNSGKTAHFAVLGIAAKYICASNKLQ